MPAARVFGLLGTNGAGKTTLISILAGQLRGATGRISADGETLEALRRRRPHTLGLVPQEYAFYPMLTCAENLRFFGAMQGLAGTRLKERIAAAAAFARIGNVLSRRAGRLSGGLKRRLNLAIGLLGEPEILLLDEPTVRSEEHTSELQSLTNLVCRLLLEKKKLRLNYVVHRLC